MGTDAYAVPLPRPSHRRPDAAAGFSLVELIVVIGIIALLIALLLPSLHRARRQAEVVDCLAHLRSIGQAAHLHVTEHQGFLPLAGWQWNCDDGDRATAAGLGDTAERKYLYYVEEGLKRPLPTTAALAMTMGYTIRTDSRDDVEADMATPAFKRMFHCPSQTVELTGWTLRGDGPGGSWLAPEDPSSYAFNEAMLGRRPAPNTDTGPRGMLTKAMHPSEVFLALDGRPRDEASEKFLLVYNFGPDDTMADFNRQIADAGLGAELPDYWRHDRKINVVFLDGHGETLPMDDAGFARIGVSHGIDQ